LNQFVNVKRFTRVVSIMFCLLLVCCRNKETPNMSQICLNKLVVNGAVTVVRRLINLGASPNKIRDVILLIQRFCTKVFCLLFNIYLMVRAVNRHS